MADSIARFALREATPEELSDSLGRSFAEYQAWHGQAIFLSGFTNDARVAGVSEVVAARICDVMSSAEKLGVLSWTERKSKTNPEIASDVAEHQLRIADSGVKLAALVILHSACERLLYRLVRFGLVANRDKALEWIAERQVSVRELAGGDVKTLIDAKLEDWWNDLERASILKKWDRLVVLFGYPVKLQTNDRGWHFDRQMLDEFDDIRINAVHHDGQKIKAFDLDKFAVQLQRALLVWLVQVAQKLQVKIQAEVFFGIEVDQGRQEAG